jgi:hypothetical protein
MTIRLTPNQLGVDNPISEDRAASRRGQCQRRRRLRAKKPAFENSQIFFKQYCNSAATMAILGDSPGSRRESPLQNGFCVST